MRFFLASAVVTLLIANCSSLAAAPVLVPLTNASFEAPYVPVAGDNGQISGSTASGWSDSSAWAKVAVQYSPDTDRPHSGVSCQKVVVQSVTEGEVQFVQDELSLHGGSIYTASVWLRGDTGSRAIVRVMQNTPPYDVFAEAYSVPLTEAWQEYTINGYVTADTAASLVIAASGPGTIWVDDASLSFTPGTFGPVFKRGPIPPAFFGMHVANYLQGRLSNAGLEAPYIPTEGTGSVSGSIARGWADNSSWADVKVRYTEDDESPHQGSSSQRIDVQSVASGAVQLVHEMIVAPGRRYTMTAWLRGPAGGSVNLILQNRNSPYTYYGTTRARLSGSWQRFSVSGVVKDAGEVLLMLQAKKPGVFSFDDVGFTGPDGKPVSGGVPWPRRSFGTLRLWDSGTAWADLEPIKGSWNFAPLDRWVRDARAHGVKNIILTLGQTPAWASSNPGVVNYYGAGAPAPPRSIQDWRDYVQLVARRYRGQIRYFEIWNEPNDPTYYSGSVADLVVLTREAARVLKAVDPRNTVISSPPYSAGFLGQLLAAGAGDYVDVIGYHVYRTPPEETGRELANVRLVMAAHRVGDKPLWDTEGASGDDKTPKAKAPALLVRKFLTDLAFGVGRFNWYSWGPASPFSVGTERGDRSLGAAGRAYGHLHTWLTGASLDNVLIDRAGSWRIRLTLAGGDAGLIVWNPKATVRFAIPHWIRVSEVDDIYGRTRSLGGRFVRVGRSPVLLRGRSRTPIWKQSDLPSLGGVPLARRGESGAGAIGRRPRRPLRTGHP